VSIGPGLVLSHYRFVEKLGEGGMGVVWKAVDTALDREVAVKLLPESVATDPDRLSRFRREAKAVAALNHPNIVTIHSVEEADGIPFFTMELVEGESLQGLLAQGELPVKRILELAIPVADALAAAQGKGITHRDIKPANVMVTRDGRVKVLDFGLARLRRDADPGLLSRADTETLEGVVLGTAPYMSPEQALGKPLDHRSDIFSFGIVLYEMATGTRPFAGETAAAVVSSILRDVPQSVDSLRPGLPQGLGRLIARCLEKEPARRYQSAGDLRNDLEDLTRETGSTPSPPAGPRPRPGRLRPRLAAAAAAATLLAVSLILAGNRNLLRRFGSSAVTGPAIQSLAVLPFENLMRDPAQEYVVQGVHDALIADLSKTGALRVISRTSVMRYRDSRKPVPEIARELGVDAVVEGSVLRAEGRLRIIAQLISGRTDQHLWAETYDRDAGNVLGSSSEIAQAIAQQIHLVLTPAVRTRLSSARKAAPEVEETLLRARFLLNQMTRENHETVLELFRRATELDPSFAPSFAGLGGAEFLGGFAGFAPLDDSMGRAEAAARKALELDEQVAQAHSVLGFIRLYYRWDWKGAEGEFRRALELNPNDPSAHHGLADCLLVTGDMNGSVREVELGRQCDPLSQMALAPVVGHLYFARRYDEAIAEAERMLKANPDYAMIRSLFMWALWGRGAYERALEEQRTISGGDVGLAMAMRRGYENGGPRVAMRAAGDFYAGQPAAADPLRTASCYASAGEADLAMTWLEKAFQARVPQLMHLKADPTFDSLRADSRFTGLLRRIGFPD
jgi:serine/threonine protein kinase